MPVPAPNKETIRRLNDEFRRTGTGGRVMASSLIQAMAPTDQIAILQAVRSFDKFSDENDPYGEHDFGSLTHRGEEVLFKIDYYDKELTGGSEDPSDPAQTTRVMTIMLSHEY